MNVAALLLADPTFGLMTTAERRQEVVALIASLGGEPDDDLGAALAVEEAEERFAAGEGGPEPERAVERPAGTEGHAPGCEGAVIAGNGRCIGCGAQIKSVAPLPTVEASLAFVAEMAARPADEVIRNIRPKPSAGTLAAFKAATRMGDRDIADTIGLARSSVQAIVSGRAGENLTPSQLNRLYMAARAQRLALDELTLRLEERV